MIAVKVGEKKSRKSRLGSRIDIIQRDMKSKKRKLNAKGELQLPEERRQERLSEGGR